VGGSIFMRMSGAVLSQIEVGLGSAEHASRWGLSRRSIREMEASIEDVRSQRFAAESSRDRAATERAAQLISASTWGDNAAYAIQKERPDLAEQAIARQIDCERQAQEAAELEEQSSTEVARLAALIEELTTERQRMAAELAELERNRPNSLVQQNTIETPEQRFERARARFLRLMEGEKVVHAQTALEPERHEIDEMRLADRVKERMATLQADAGLRAKRSPKRR